MKQKFYLLVLMACLVLISRNTFAYSTQNKSLKAYLTISFQNQEMFKDSTTKSVVESNIISVFKKEGIHIISEEKPDKYEEYKLYINVTLRDSLVIEAKGMTWDMAVSIEKYPRLSFPYKNESDIYRAVKSYIKKNIIVKSK
jgi:hypothetical protein